MPLYEYAHVSDEYGECDERFEVFQKLDEPKLTRCPKCGRECRRLISAPAVNANPDAAVLSLENIERHGFTQYRRERDGTYKKTAGKGPDTITK